MSAGSAWVCLSCGRAGVVLHDDSLVERVAYRAAIRQHDTRAAHRRTKPACVGSELNVVLAFRQPNYVDLCQRELHEART